jgi:hypothetical protein
MSLKQKLESQLHQARGGAALTTCPNVDPTSPILPSTANGPKKLGMIEDVETFEPELQRLGFRQPYILEQRHIEVVHTRTVEVAPLRGSRRAQNILTK